MIAIVGHKREECAESTGHRHVFARSKVVLLLHRIVAYATDMAPSRSAAAQMDVIILPSMEECAEGMGLSSKNVQLMSAPIERRTEEYAESMERL
jgi:metallophosphoesterase superfamily enzyme